MDFMFRDLALRDAARSSLARERRLRDHVNPLDIYEEEEFRSIFRFSKEGVMDLATHLSPYLKRNSRSDVLNPIQRTCIGLRFYATGAMQLSLAMWMQVDQSTVSRVSWEVTCAILNSLRSRVQWPSRNQINMTKDRFFDQYNFPMTVGCIDCTHVRIEAPNARYFPDEYINRKGFHSMNVQAICDDEYRFIDISAEWPCKLISFKC